MGRQMARKTRTPRPSTPVIALGVGVLAILGLVGAMVIFGGHRSAAPTTSPLASGRPSLVAHESPSQASSASASHSAPPSSTSSATPTGTPVQATPTPASADQPSAAPDAAPQSAARFDLQGQVIDIGFPLRADTTYHYRDNWYERRSGRPDSYNHAKLAVNGELVRLHDGIDIYAPENEPVLAPFDGVVIDPATKWTPWEPDRYGLTVVVESDAATSNGYTAVLVHLDRVWVDMGQHVTRGQVIGVLGRTGNAESVPPQLHFELRAPFLLDWTPLGEDRMVDAFNPYPSLVAGDPKPSTQPSPGATPSASPEPNPSESETPIR
jgi:murein DD-endopeptidase MepM/ murein hydrolase activator NlpD